MWRGLVPGFLFTVLVIFFWQGLSLDPGELPSPLIGKPAPAFDLPRLLEPGQRVGSSDLAGKPYILNVWGSWCVGCRQEHQTLMEIAKLGLVPIYGLNWKDERQNAVDWLRQLGDPYVATAFDPQGDVCIDWGVYGAPETFLVDAAGVVRHKHIGPMTMTAWREDFMPHILQAVNRQ